MNNTLPNYDEKSTSQFSAVKQLINMGYNYLTIISLGKKLEIFYISRTINIC